jgi:hypothetical protein
MIQNFFNIGNTQTKHLFPETTVFFEDSNYQKHYDDILNQLLTTNSLICPKCKGNEFSIHSSYTRYIVDTPEQQINDEYYTLEIKVVYCHHCNLYHAVLPALIPAFSHYSYHFIFSVLSHFRKFNNAKETCIQYSISKHMLQIFINKVEVFFLRHIKSELLCLLQCNMKSLKERRKLFIDFLMHFFVSQSSHCTLKVFFGRTLFLGIIIPNHEIP